MARIIKDKKAHFETHEFPFGRIYEWHPKQTIVECDCGERLTLSATSTTTVCRCGTDHEATIRETQKRERQSPDEITHPWRHDLQEQKEQHQRDEAAYPKGSTWRYNDVTADNSHGD